MFKFLQRAKFICSLLIDLIIALFLMSFSVYLITQAQENQHFIVWINFGIATTFRIVIIGIRVLFEYLVERIALSTIYLFLASISFLYSAHVMPQFYFSLLVVAIVDLGLVILLVTFIVMIKCLSRKQNMTLKCR